ncbi:MAG: DUF4417 domain-containing protein [Oscillospiraceae bacterium]
MKLGEFMYDEKLRYENLQYGLLETFGKYDIPKLESVKLQEIPELISFNYAKSAKEKSSKGIHFFVDDYQFVRLWNNPKSYINLLSQFRLVFTPDFSLYTDFPVAMQIYNHYRKHWLGAYWQSQGITVVPTICWSDEKSFDWCFDGEPVGGTVTVSSVGTQNNKQAKQAFMQGYDEMIKRLNPETIIFYGNVPDECKGNIISIRPFHEKFDSITKR